MGRARRAGPEAWVHRSALGGGPPGRTAGPGQAHAGRGPWPVGRGPRRGDEHGRRRRICSHAQRPRPAAAGATRTGQAQPPGTRASHPGRPGHYRRPDRRQAVHQRPHSRLAPGPDPGEDRLPPSRRPDPPSAHRRPGVDLMPMRSGPVMGLDGHHAAGDDAAAAVAATGRCRGAVLRGRSPPGLSRRASRECARYGSARSAGTGTCSWRCQMSSRPRRSGRPP